MPEPALRLASHPDRPVGASDFTPREATLPEPAPDLIKPWAFSLASLSKLIDRSVSALERDRAAKRLPPAIKIGGSLRWRSQDIQLWLDWGCPDECEFIARRKLLKK